MDVPIVFFYCLPSEYFKVDIFVICGSEFSIIRYSSY